MEPQTPQIRNDVPSKRPGLDAGLDLVSPIWSLADVGMVAGFFFLASFFFIMLGLLIASGLPMFKAKTAVQIVSDVRIAVLTQFAAYLATFWFLYRMIARHYGVPFLEGIRWAWPKAKWPVYLILGVGMAYAITGLQALVPMPAEVPLDKFLKTTLGAWVLAVFGSLVAPFAEEVFFRGLLYPTLARKSSAWASIGVTALLFTLLHGSQLGWSWGPLLLLFSVGATLTIIRAFTSSVAASTLVHIAYNLTLFVFLYVGTNGFRNLDKAVH